MLREIDEKETRRGSTHVLRDGLKYREEITDVANGKDRVKHPAELLVIVTCWKTRICEHRLGNNHTPSENEIVTRHFESTTLSVHVGRNCGAVAKDPEDQRKTLNENAPVTAKRLDPKMTRAILRNALRKEMNNRSVNGAFDVKYILNATLTSSRKIHLDSPGLSIWLSRPRERIPLPT